MKTYENYFKDCEFCEQTYCEYDTGYAEYICNLLQDECLCDLCPLSFKYELNTGGIKTWII